VTKHKQIVNTKVASMLDDQLADQLDGIEDSEGMHEAVGIIKSGLWFELKENLGNAVMSKVSTAIRKEFTNGQT
jgi:hypothetical protein